MKTLFTLSKNIYSLISSRAFSTSDESKEEENNTTSSNSTSSSGKNWTKQSDISSSKNNPVTTKDNEVKPESESVSFDSLHNIFKEPIKVETQRIDKGKTIVIFRPEELLNDRDFVMRLLYFKFVNTLMYAKVVYNPNLVRMLGKQTVLSSNNSTMLVEYRQQLVNNIINQMEEYKFTSDRISHIILTAIPLDYNILSKYKVDSSKRIPTRSFIDSNFSSKTIIPISVDPSLLGGELNKTVSNGKITNLMFFEVTGSGMFEPHSLRSRFILDKTLAHLSPKFKFYKVRLNNRSYILGLHYLSSNSVRKIRISFTGLILDDLVDTVLSNGNVKRISNNNVLILDKDRVVEYYKLTSFPFIKNINKGRSSTENPNIGVIDLETYTDDNNISKVYAAGFKTYLDRKVTMYYIGDELVSGKPLDSPDIILTLVNELLRTKYSKTTFYCHNLGGFDVVFLIKVLVDFNKVNTEKYKLDFRFRDNKILSITIGKGVNKLVIKDSYCILTSSLRSLAKAYDCDYQKSYFPYSFCTTDTLFYKGITPSIGYYEDISSQDYSKLYSENWSLKHETLKYLELDLLTLYEVLTKANKQFFLDYDLDMTKPYTISGIALNLFLSKYYKNNIPVISKKSIYTELKQAYYGGITEVYIPYGENLFYYDINSLYPYAALNDMPGLECKNIITTTSKDISFGFFYCEIDATNVNQKYLGLLPYRSNGLTFPLGKWSGWYFSEELKFAKEHGYKITVIKGYEFNRISNMFDGYVKDIYKTKANASNVVQKTISKSLLNNLLGRFGINLEKYETSLVDGAKLQELSLIYDVNDYTPIGDMNLISHSTAINYERLDELGLDINKVLESNKDSETKSQSASSVVISAAVTSYARIIISKHKLDILSRGGKIYYSDTDSIVTNMELPSELVSNNELGKFKLEHKVKQGIFISGKTYCLVLQDDSLIKKAKGVEAEKLSYHDFVNLLNSNRVLANKKTSIKNYTEGSVTVKTIDMLLKGDVYIKRDKIFDNKIWIDTKPLYINNIDKFLIKYVEPCLSLLVIYQGKSSLFFLPGNSSDIETEFNNTITKNTSYAL